MIYFGDPEPFLKAFMDQPHQFLPLLHLTQLRFIALSLLPKTALNAADTRFHVRGSLFNSGGE